MSTAVVAFHRVSLLVCSAMMIVTACAACTVTVKPQDKPKDEAAATTPVAAPPPPVVAVAAAATAAPVAAAPAQRPTSQPAAAAPVARAPNSKGVGESCTVNSHTECRIGLFCEAHGVCKVPPSATRTASTGTFASGRVCGLDSSCASGVCLPTPGSAFGKCK